MNIQIYRPLDLLINQTDDACDWNDIGLFFRHWIHLVANDKYFKNGYLKCNNLVIFR